MAEETHLLDFVASMGGERALRIEENLGAGYVRLRVAEAERRQAKHDIRCVEDIVIEMLRNSRDAGARHIYVATTREDNIRSLVVLDDGSGIPLEMQERIFDARVTSKLESVHVDRWGVHGRGMALYSIKENTLSAKVLSSAAGLGASIQIIADTKNLSERADQSSWPHVGVDDDGQKALVRGPHNIVRTCCEFALESKGSCDVFLGSPAEIAATARVRIPQSMSSADLLFIDNLAEVPVLERFRVASDARELCEICATLGLTLSERTAHRILSGQIKPIRSCYARLFHTGEATGPKEIDLLRDRRSLKLSRKDEHEFARLLEKDFSFLSDRYYLSMSNEPKIRVGKGKIVVTFELDPED
ncbi:MULTISPECIES: ATP-binding protein [Atopobiaceae]|uniref:ATP-binding protein n=1 Tax=Atopobiaceae TaxID=1643824 RepID=UPI00034E9BB0|nr:MULTISPECIES: ATP-binding protein [Atopobiaceae]EPD78111.1 hypothetical protein HMPREF1527_00418 [Atopobium sp. oral taxon 199 str. F0494]